MLADGSTVIRSSPAWPSPHTPSRGILRRRNRRAGEPGPPTDSIRRSSGCLAWPRATALFQPASSITQSLRRIQVDPVGLAGDGDRAGLLTALVSRHLVQVMTAVQAVDARPGDVADGEVAVERTRAGKRFRPGFRIVSSTSNCRPTVTVSSSSKSWGQSDLVASEADRPRRSRVASPPLASRTAHDESARSRAPACRRQRDAGRTTASTAGCHRG